ncbi:MAG: hypothetical protein AB7N71_02035 [Phycisphaerae bacterium]
MRTIEDQDVAFQQWYGRIDMDAGEFLALQANTNRVISYSAGQQGDKLADVAHALRTQQ